MLATIATVANTKTKRGNGGRKTGKKSRRSPGRPGGAPNRISPATASDWFGGARLRTLPLAVAPVLVGAGASVVALGDHQFHWLRALACLAVAVCLQIGVNFANDYSDGIRGTDTYRQGPSRLTGTGKAKARTVLIVALAFFTLAALAGLALVVRTQHWWMLVVGAAAIAAAWFYTGGKRPYGYYALGEVFVFVFFGLVATAGTQYMLAGTVSTEGWLGGVAVGLVATAVLVANNVRDREQDKLAGKRTLSVLVGDRASRILYCVLLVPPFAIVWFFGFVYPLAWLGWFALLAAVPAVLIVLTGKTPRELVLALGLTSLTALFLGAALGVAFGV